MYPAKLAFILVLSDLVCCSGPRSLIELRKHSQSESKALLANDAQSSLENSMLINSISDDINEMASIKKEEGQLYFFTPDDCRFLIKTLGNCQGNNYESPYGLLFFAKDGEDEGFQGIGPEGMAPLWNMDEDEAIIFVMETPPELRYFGLTSYLADRHAAHWPKDIDGERVFTLASLGDSLNHLTIGTSQLNTAVPFSEVAVVIITANKLLEKQLEKDLLAKLRGKGVPGSEKMINFLPINPFDTNNPIFLGSENLADRFMILFRVAEFLDDLDGSKKKQYMEQNLSRVFKLKFGNSFCGEADNCVQYQDYPLVKNRYLPGGTELEFRDLTNNVAAFIKSKYFSSQTGMIAPLVGANVLGVDWGIDCVIKAIPCLGDNRDTPYLGSLPIEFHKDGSSDIYVVGVNHADYLEKKLGPEFTYSYSSISLNIFERAVGVGSINDGSMKGSVDEFLTKAEKLRLGISPSIENSLFIVKLSKNCQGFQFCLEIPFNDGGTSEDSLKFSDGDHLILAERVYANRNTTVGAAYEQIVNARIVVGKWQNGSRMPATSR